VLVCYAVSITVREADDIVNGDAGPGAIGDFQWLELTLGCRAGNLGSSAEVAVTDVTGDVFC